MELNQKALDVVTSNFGTRYAGVIACYVRACNQEKEPKPIPFDASLVKPGDKVIVNDALKAVYIGMSQNGNVCVEADHLPDGAGLYAPTSITIPPKSVPSGTLKKTMAVRLFKPTTDSQTPTVVPETLWHAYLTSPSWKPCSAIVEIEVTK